MKPLFQQKIREPLQFAQTLLLRFRQIQDTFFEFSVCVIEQRRFNVNLCNTCNQWKGLSVGGAQVSTKHSGFVVNTGGATAADVLALVALVQEKVYAHSGILLEPEVRLWK